MFQNAKDKLENAVVVIDKSGNLDFRRQLAKYLRRKMNEEGRKSIKKVKMQRSKGNNLLQLADYIAGVINRFAQGKKFVRIIGKLLPIERFMFKFGQNKTSEPIPYGNAAINATVRLGSNSIIILAETSRDVNSLIVENF